MSRFSVLHTTICGVGCALGISLLSLSAAHADVLGSTTAVDFTGGSTSFAYDMSTFTFSDNGTSPFDGAPVSITTAGTGEVTALGEPFYSSPTPSTSFDPVRGSGVLIYGAGSGYSAFPTATAIPYSTNSSFVGLEVSNADNTYYGYAAFAGTDLTSYAFETTPGVGIQAGAPITGPLQPVPEPASFALLGMGVLGLTLLRRKYRA